MKFGALIRRILLFTFLVVSLWGDSFALTERIFVLEKGESFVNKLVEADLSKAEAVYVSHALSKYINFSSLPSGWSFSVVYDERGVPLQVVVTKDVGVEYRVDLRFLKISEKKLRVKIYEKEVIGVIGEGESIYTSILEKTENPQVAIEFARIFGHRIDFHTWTRPGDFYAFICRVIEDEKGRKKYDRILVAKYEGKKVKADAAFYKGVYYDSKGRPLIGYFLASPFSGMFLRAPLRYKRVSSGFSYHRRHPILGVVRPHLGVDYAAPEGTPIKAVADGVVVWKGWIRGFGRTIKIKHRWGIITQYAHMRRYARGIRVGKRVRKGQVIGYVGHTGLATGPHLDFRIKYKGRYVNPLKFLAKYSHKFYVSKKVKKLTRKDLSNIALLFERLNRAIASYNLSSKKGT